MKMFTAKACLTTTLIALLLCAMANGEDPAKPTTAPSPPAVGDTAKDFTLKGLDGKEVRLYDLTKDGPVVLLALRGWVGYQCPICTRQVGQFIARQKDFAAAGATVLMVYPGPSAGLEDHAQDFISGKGLPASFHFVIDPDLSFVNLYGLRWDAPHETAYPSTFVIDRNAIVRFAKISHTHGDRATPDQTLKVIDK